MSLLDKFMRGTLGRVTHFAGRQIEQGPFGINALAPDTIMDKYGRYLPAAAMIALGGYAALGAGAAGGTAAGVGAAEGAGLGAAGLGTGSLGLTASGGGLGLTSGTVAGAGGLGLSGGTAAGAGGLGFSAGAAGTGFGTGLFAGAGEGIYDVGALTTVASTPQASGAFSVGPGSAGSGAGTGAGGVVGGGFEAAAPGTFSVGPGSAGAGAVSSPAMTLQDFLGFLKTATGGSSSVGGGFGLGSSSSVLGAGAPAGGSMGMVGSGLNLGSSLYGLYESAEMQRLGKKAANAPPFDPLGYGERAQWLQQLQALTSDPSSITGMPGYQAGMEAVNRSMASQGYIGSGNMMNAMSQYGGGFYDREVARLAGLAGAQYQPTPQADYRAGIAASGQGAALAGNSLANLGYLARSFGW